MDDIRAKRGKETPFFLGSVTLILMMNVKTTKKRVLTSSG
jgi:hypothetical protein